MGYQTAMRAEGFLDFAVTRHGHFQARLTQVALDRLRLFAVKEALPRIALVGVPEDQALISLPLDGASPLLWNGASAQVESLITFGPGSRVHARTEGPVHWGAIWFPINDLTRYSQALTGEALTIPSFECIWRPPTIASRSLNRLFTYVIQAARKHPDTRIAPEAAHGLDQQLIHVLIECLSGRPINIDIWMRRRRHELMVQFERLVTTAPVGDVSVAALSEALNVSDRFLRRCCGEQFGMSPSHYIKFRRLQLIHRALQCADAQTLSVSQAAGRHGFRHLGRFAADYRALFGQQPSATLRQGPYQTFPELSLRRRSARATRTTTSEIAQ
jgi:AraC-like DNA-binding protein